MTSINSLYDFFMSLFFNEDDPEHAEARAKYIADRDMTPEDLYDGAGLILDRLPTEMATRLSAFTAGAGSTFNINQGIQISGGAVAARPPLRLPGESSYDASCRHASYLGRAVTNRAGAGGNTYIDDRDVTNIRNTTVDNSFRQNIIGSNVAQNIDNNPTTAAGDNSTAVGPGGRIGVNAPGSNISGQVQGAGDDLIGTQAAGGSAASLIGDAAATTIATGGGRGNDQIQVNQGRGNVNVGNQDNIGRVGAGNDQIQVNQGRDTINIGDQDNVGLGARGGGIGRDGGVRIEDDFGTGGGGGRGRIEDDFGTGGGRGRGRIEDDFGTGGRGDRGDRIEDDFGTGGGGRGGRGGMGMDDGDVTGMHARGGHAGMHDQGGHYGQGDNSSTGSATIPTGDAPVHIDPGADVNNIGVGEAQTGGNFGSGAGKGGSAPVDHQPSTTSVGSTPVTGATVDPAYGGSPADAAITGTNVPTVDNEEYSSPASQPSQSNDSGTEELSDPQIQENMGHGGADIGGSAG